MYDDPCSGCMCKYGAQAFYRGQTSAPSVNHGCPQMRTTSTSFSHWYYCPVGGTQGIM
jgi:hypothetical protein